MTKKRISKKVTGLFVAGALCAALAAGGTVSYLTDHEAATNVFTIGIVDIEETEPNYTPNEDGEIPDIQPTQDIPKDPQITNVGINDAYVYMDVSIPIAKVITAAEDGTRANNGDAVDTELFTQTGLNLSTDEDQSGWNLMYKKRVGSNMIYTYNYDKVLKAGETTKPLFTSVVFANVIEGQIDEETLCVPVKSYAIQTLNTEADGDSTVREKAVSAWDKYVNQNAGQPGEVTTTN